MAKVNNLSSKMGLEVDPDRLRRVASQHLEQLHHAGLTMLPAGTGEVFPVDQSPGGVPVPVVPDSEPTPLPRSTPADRAMHVREVAGPASLSTKLPPGRSPAAGQPASSATSGVRISGQDADRQLALDRIQTAVAACTRCELLCGFRTQTVFGAGNPKARLVLVGEAPGEQEDREGVPFVGAAGQLLDKILAACGLSRDDVYILNSLKCRPPQNRTPRPEELSNCWEYGRSQLDILQPEFICCLGSVAAKTVLNTNQSVGRLRRQFHAYGKSRVLVTYHPAYLLRTTSAKKHAWDDMKMLMQAMGITIPPASR